MAIDKENLELRHDKLMEAFQDEGLRKELEIVCNEIYDIINAWLKTIENYDAGMENVFHLQSRVKGIPNFEEKLYRKNYIRDWDVSENKEENKELIKKVLTDLIGIRVNCYFMKNEKILYDEFKKAVAEEKFPDFKLNFKENTDQKNKHKIWKFSGIYKDSYHFEVQIKSIVHNMWGEVDHKVIYKNPVYDGYIAKKKEISDALFNVFTASDNELYSVYTMRESEEQLLRSLFFLYTKDIIATRCKTKVLADHYENYFNVFKDIAPVKEYVICKLTNTEYQLKELPTINTAPFAGLKTEVEKWFPLFYFDCIYKIGSLLYHYENLDTFIFYVLQLHFPEIHDAVDEEIDKEFMDSDSEQEVNAGDAYGDKIAIINDLLGKCKLNHKKE